MPYRRKKLTFAISSPDEFLSKLSLHSSGCKKSLALHGNCDAVAAGDGPVSKNCTVLAYDIECA